MRITEKSLFFVIQGELADGEARLAVPDFTGFWECDLSRSQAPIAISLEIVHREPRLEMARRRVYPTWSDEWKIDLTTDGTVHHEIEAGGESHTAMSWDDRVLVLTSEFRVGDAGGGYESRLSILPEGRCFILVERLRGLGAGLDSAWWFNRSCPDGGWLQ
jgi:hypothetical protein